MTHGIAVSVRRFVTHHFVRDAITLQAGQFVLVGVQALTNILLIRILGTELLGVYTLAVTLAGIVGVLDLSGSGRVTITQLSRAIGAGDTEGTRDILAYFLRITLQINIPLVILFLAVAPLAADALYHRLDISLFARWLVLQRLTDIPIHLIAIAYQCRGDMRRLVIFETSKLALSALFVISALLLGWAVQGLVLATTLVNAGYALASVVLYRRLAQSDTRFPTWLELFSRMWSVDVKRWFRLGFYIALQKNLDALSEHVLMMLFGTMGVDFTGRISVALKIVTLPQPLISGIARNLDSFLPKRVGQNESNLLRVFTQTTLYTAAIWSLVTLGMAIAGPVLLIVLFPEQADVVPLLYPLLIQSIAIGFGVGIGPTMRTIGRVEYLIVIHSIIVALTIPVGTWLIRSMGLYGAAWLVGLQQSIETALMLGIVFWLLRRRVRAAS